MHDLLCSSRWTSRCTYRAIAAGSGLLATHAALFADPGARSSRKARCLEACGLHRAHMQLRSRRVRHGRCSLNAQGLGLQLPGS